MLVFPSSLTFELATSLKPRVVRGGGLLWEELLVFFEVEISISVGFGAGVVMVRLVGYYFIHTYLGRTF